MYYIHKTPKVQRKSGSTYLFWLLLLLPIDWFEPTGSLLREFGAKPANIFLTVGALSALAFLRPVDGGSSKHEVWVLVVVVILNILNLLAFTTNIVVQWSDFSSVRRPEAQFLNQSLLLIFACLALLGNVRYFSRINIEPALIYYLPRVATIHLSVWCLEAAFPELFRPFLSSFRVGGVFIDRASGLMSEPSYYGTMAAMFAVPLILARQFEGKWIVKIVAIGLLISAFTVSAKTAVLVAALQVIYFIFFGKSGRIKSLSLFFTISLATLFFVQNKAALDLEANLSSVNRIGSAHLALNIVGSKLVITGIGAGQFHFQYRSENAPAYLFLSHEALAQMSPHSETRASTYNFPLRVIVELGVIGFFLIFAGLSVLLALPRVGLVLPRLLLLGALGFLLTQDTYFYPPFVLACSLIIAGLAPRSKANHLQLNPVISNKQA